MLPSEDLASLENILSSSKSFLIIIRSNPSLDQVAAALSLYLALQQQRKEVSIACPDPMKVEFGNLVAINHVSTEVGNHVLRISFDYSEEQVDNVSYDEDKQNGKFHLLIRPQKGERPLDPSSIEFSHVGVDAETIIMFGVQKFDEIRQFYANEEQAFRDAHTVAINRSKTKFANSNFDVSGVSSYSELVGLAMRQLKWEPDADTATNLLAGIEHATDSFRQLVVTADTFELSAILLRQGARRLRVTNGNSQQTSQTSSLAQAFANQQKNSQQTQSSPQSKPTEPENLGVPQLKRVQQPAPGNLNYTPPVR